jgi:hypothetical protein
MTGTSGLFETIDSNDTYFSGPNLVLGVQIEWGLTMLNWAPFTMEVWTENWYGLNDQPLNRRLTIRMDNQMKDGCCEAPGCANGGIFDIPFAQEIQADETSGYYPARGGMSQAIVQPAVIPRYGITPFDTDAQTPGAMGIPNFDMAPTGGGWGDDPYDSGMPNIYDLRLVKIQIPSHLNDYFNATVRLLTAGSPYLAAYIESTMVNPIVNARG